MELNDTTESRAEKTETTNEAGGVAYSPVSSEMALYKVVMNNLLENKYYEDDEESLSKVRDRFNAVAEDNPEFALKLASYARNEMGLRDISQVLLVLSALDERTKEYVPKYGSDIMRRTDEPLKVLNFYISEKGSTSVNEYLRDAIEDALHNYDEYQYAKYNRDSREMTYQDLLNLVHPTPRDDEHSEIFEKIALGELDDHPDVEPLKTPETWETVISEKGNTEEAWRSVLDRMGLFAKIRNARNMLEAGLTGDEIFGEFDNNDSELVKNHKMFPFRFYQSYKAITDARVDDRASRLWLEEAMNETVDNLPSRLTDTVVGVDTSGSMSHSLSNKSNMTYMEIATFFGAVLYKQGADVYAFASDVEELTEVRPEDSVMTIMKAIINLDVGGSTNGWKLIKTVRNDNIEADRLVMLTDMQIWDNYGYRSRSNTVKNEWDKYREKVNSSLYMLDLSSYGSLQTPEGYDSVYNISGWNSKIVDFIEYAEDEGEIIEEVEQYAI
jgi:hypothetical protein